MRSANVRRGRWINMRPCANIKHMLPAPYGGGIRKFSELQQNMAESKPHCVWKE